MNVLLGFVIGWLLRELFNSVLQRRKNKIWRELQRTAVYKWSACHIYDTGKLLCPRCTFMDNQLRPIKTESMPIHDGGSYPRYRCGVCGFRWMWVENRRSADIREGK